MSKKEMYIVVAFIVIVGIYYWYTKNMAKQPAASAQGAAPIPAPPLN
jgi:hypothetical protein